MKNKFENNVTKQKPGKELRYNDLENKGQNPMLGESKPRMDNKFKPGQRLISAKRKPEEDQNDGSVNEEYKTDKVGKRNEKKTGQRLISAKRKPEEYKNGGLIKSETLKQNSTNKSPKRGGKKDGQRLISAKRKPEDDSIIEDSNNA